MPGDLVPPEMKSSGRPKAWHHPYLRRRKWHPWTTAESHDFTIIVPALRIEEGLDGEGLDHGHIGPAVSEHAEDYWDCWS